jgi:hypothetical protein
VPDVLAVVKVREDCVDVCEVADVRVLAAVNVAVPLLVKVCVVVDCVTVDRVLEDVYEVADRLEEEV